MRSRRSRAMTDKARIRIAAAVTALFLAGISAAGLAARDERPQPATTAPASTTATPAAAIDGSVSPERRSDDRFSEEVEDDE